MNYWENHLKLRSLLMLVTFAAGIGLLVFGWTLTGQMGGLLLMLLGVAFLLATLNLYNQRFQEPKNKKTK
ncbi:MAG: hypothetical protein HFF18_08045 [Oscillospiraceae bacterium]|nr:hypothetical protein [Oscillospiraceae bacterium]